MRVVLRAVLLVTALVPGFARGQSPTVLAGPYQARPMPSPTRSAPGAWGPGPDRPWSWPTLEQVRPDIGQESQEQLLDWLVASEDAQRAEAQIRLMPSADALLPRLELLAASTWDEEERARLLEFLQVLTRRRIRLEQLGSYPNLSALAARSLERGRELVAPWVEERTADELVEERSGGGFCGVGSSPSSDLFIEGKRLQRLRDQLREHGGLALPAVEQLLASPFAPARLQGLVLASALGLHPSPETLARLQRDQAEVELSAYTAPSMFSSRSEKYRSKVPIAQSATLLARGLAEPRPRISGQGSVALDIENRINELLSTEQLLGKDDAALRLRGMSQDLTNALRGTGAWKARDEQAYWNRARPLWRAWWRAVGPRVDTYDRNLWFNLSNSYEGYQLVSRARRNKLYILHIAEPAGAEVEVTSLKARHESTVRRATLPLTLRAAPAEHSMKVRVWVAGGWKDVVWVVASLGGRVWRDMEWVEEGAGKTVTLWIHPELRRHHLETLR